MDLKAFGVQAKNAGKMPAGSVESSNGVEGIGVGIERQKELRRRRHRRKKLDQMKKKLDKASVSEKSYMSTKIRRLTPGAETIISSLALDER